MTAQIVMRSELRWEWHYNQRRCVSDITNLNTRRYKFQNAVASLNLLQIYCAHTGFTGTL